MSKLGRACAERKMMSCDKYVCLGGATAVAARRGMQPRGPTNKGHGPPVLHLFWGGRSAGTMPAVLPGEREGKGGQRTAALQRAAGENKLLWGGQGEAKARKDGVRALAAFLGARPPL